MEFGKKATQSSKKKLFLFSSQKSADILSARIHDLAYKSGCSDSAIIENALMQSLFPTEPSAYACLELLYCRSDAPNALAEAYESIFKGLSNGTYSAAYNKVSPLIQLFYWEISQSNTELIGTEPDWRYLFDQLHNIRDILDAKCKAPITKEESMFLKNTMRNVDWILSQDQRNFTIARSCARTISEDWELCSLGSIKYSYLALVAISRIVPIQSTPESRNRFASVLIRISSV